MGALRLLLLLACVAPLWGTIDHLKRSVPMKKFTVDLDKPPEDRWLELISNYNSSVPLIVDYFDQEVGAYKSLRENTL